MDGDVRVHSVGEEGSWRDCEDVVVFGLLGRVGMHVRWVFGGDLMGQAMGICIVVGMASVRFDIAVGFGRSANVSTSLCGAR